jgi:hypothetical protein
MNHIDGVQLQQVWPHMNAGQRIRCIESIYRKLKQIADLDFPAYGSLYLTGMSTQSSSEIPLDQYFFVGPHCGEMYWNCNPMEPRYYHHTPPNHLLTLLKV